MKEFKYAPLSGWLALEGPMEDIVINSRISLYRNIEGFPYTSSPKFNDDMAKIILSLVQTKLEDNEMLSGLFSYSAVSDIDILKKHCMIEENLISPRLLSNEVGRGVLLSDNGLMTVSINDTDHIRETVIYPGLTLETMYRQISEVDEQLASCFLFDKDDKYGYKTSRLTETGSGIFASTMLHLPHLDKENIKQLEAEAHSAKLEFREMTSVRSMRSTYSVFNRASFGRSAEEIIGAVTRLTEKAAMLERVLCIKALKENTLGVVDSVMRAYALMQYVQLISAKEAAAHTSVLRSGMTSGVCERFEAKIKAKDLKLIEMSMRTAHIKYFLGEAEDAVTLDKMRACVIRANMASVIKENS